MDKSFIDGVREQVPKINPYVANGLATEQLRYAEQYLDQIFREAAREFPEGLVYKGCRLCTPSEELSVVTRAKDGKRSLELARSDVYLVAYIFEYRGVELFPKYIYLPYAEPGGLIHISGNRFSIKPVLADPTFSVGMSGMFIHLTKIKLTFERQLTHHFFADDRVDTGYVVYSWIHNKAIGKTKKTIKTVYSSLTNYLFAKYGVTETFLRFAGIEVQIGDEETINDKVLNKKEWVICKSRAIAPKSWGTHRPYVQTNVRIAVKRDKYNYVVKGLLAALFYMLDSFPNRIYLEHIDNPETWKSVLGATIFGEGINVGLMLREIDDHLNSCEGYVDFLSVDDFRRDGLEINDFYELLYHVIETLTQTSVRTFESISSIYDKRLITLRYVMYDLSSAVSMIAWSLKTASRNNPDLDEKTITGIMNKYLKLSKISGVVKHSELDSASTSSDNMFFGITSAIISQDKATQKSRKARINMNNPTIHIHSSIALVGSYNNLPKADPTGRSRINPCVKTTPDGMIIVDPDVKEFLDVVQRDISA